MSQVYPLWSDILHMPTFIINMDDCPDRMTITEKRVRDAGYTDVRRMAAIDARTCDLSVEWAVHGSPPFDTRDTEFVTYPGKQCCHLSWLKMLTYIITNEIPYATIFEDDVIFHKDYADLAPAFYEGTPKNFDYIYLGCQLDNPGAYMEITNAPAFCTHALFFTLEGAKKLKKFLLNFPEGISTIDCMIHKTVSNTPKKDMPFVYYAWNALKFHDPARFMPKDWTKRNIGLVFQDYDLGTFVRPW